MKRALYAQRNLKPILQIWNSKLNVSLQAEIGPNVFIFSLFLIAHIPYVCE